MSSIQINGDTSGSVILSAPAVAGSTTITLPATSGTAITTGDTATVTPTMLSTGAPSWTSAGVLSFNSGYGSVAAAAGCRAWVNFNGVTTVTVRASFNVSSVTRNAAGDYTVNFTTSMPDANYSVVGLNQYDQTNTTLGAAVFMAIARFTTALQAGSVRVICNGTSSTLFDTTTTTVAIFR